MNTYFYKAIRVFSAGAIMSVALVTLNGCGTTSGAVVGGVAGAAAGGTVPAAVGGAVVGGVVGHEINKHD
jgi:osmotically inducible lipoprotein OsmB